MAIADVQITDAVGLHARPAAQFVKLASTFDAQVTVTNHDRTADAKSLLQVLQLEAGKGCRVTIEATGAEADAAVAALSALLAGSHA